MGDEASRRSAPQPSSESAAQPSSARSLSSDAAASDRSLRSDAAASDRSLRSEAAERPRVSKGGPRVIAVFGGRSEIGSAIAERLAPGNTVVLLARPGSLAEQEQACLAAGAVRVVTLEFDADAIEGHAALVDRIESTAGPIDVAVLAFGVLGDQAEAEHDHRAAAAILHTDFVAQASLLTALAERLRTRGSGTLVAFSSVAGVRVRRANYVYGSAKAGLDGFASGLADSLHGTGVRLIIARPGFVVGRMTAGMDPAPFSSTPGQVADAVVREIRQGRRVELWIPWQLRVMFSVAPFIPRAIWRRLPR